MSGNKLFLDTNILLYFLGGDSDIVELLSDKSPVISFITELELLSFSDFKGDQEEMTQSLIDNCQLINWTSELKELTIELKRRYRLKLPDAIIAASAYYLNLPLLTGDKQFRQLQELEVLIYEV